MLQIRPLTGFNQLILDLPGVGVKSPQQERIMAEDLLHLKIKHDLDIDYF